MRRDPRVFLMGENVALIGGIFQVTQGLYDEFGPERARDTPISESTFVGCGFGAAVIEHAFGDLDAPPLRIGTSRAPMPYNDRLERATIPGEEEIIQGVRAVLA
jgi:pyruvate/2-oxoglutarate/acetoin dehydrogenase E1 component